PFPPSRNDASTFPIVVPVKYISSPIRVTSLLLFFFLIINRKNPLRITRRHLQWFQSCASIWILPDRSIWTRKYRHYLQRQSVQLPLFHHRHLLRRLWPRWNFQ